MSKYTKEEIDFLMKNYERLGAAESGRILKRNPESVRIKATKGLMLKWCGVKPNEARNVNPEHFYNITMPEVAYFLGYFWADGHIHSYKSNQIKHHRIAIELKECDGKHLRKIVETFGKWAIVKRSRQRTEGGSTQKMLAIVINNEPVYRFLFENGYDRKSIDSPTKILSKIPEKFHPAFWLGFFDGDGWILEDKAGLGFAGSFEQDWKEQVALLKKLSVTPSFYPYISKKGHKSSSIVVQNLDGVLKFYKYIEPYAHLGLERKQLKFKNFLKLKML